MALEALGPSSTVTFTLSSTQPSSSFVVDTEIFPQSDWQHRVLDVAFALMYVLSAGMCFALGVMLMRHMYIISIGETTVEAARGRVTSRGDVGSFWLPF